jgi:hypothetical protein
MYGRTHFNHWGTLTLEISQELPVLCSPQNYNSKETDGHVTAKLGNYIKLRTGQLFFTQRYPSILTSTTLGSLGTTTTISYNIKSICINLSLSALSTNTWFNLSTTGMIIKRVPHDMRHYQRLGMHANMFKE